MTSDYIPPRTYQQWLECFAHLREHPQDAQMLRTLARGTYPGEPGERFLERLSQAVGEALSACCKGFLRRVDLALEDGEPELAGLLARRLKTSIGRCFFYRELEFLPASYVRTLDAGFEEQMESFWRDFLRHLDKIARQTMAPELEDMVLELKRIKIIPREENRT